MNSYNSISKHLIGGLPELFFVNEKEFKVFSIKQSQMYHKQHMSYGTEFLCRQSTDWLIFTKCKQCQYILT